MDIPHLIRWQPSQARRWPFIIATALLTGLIGWIHLLTGWEIEFHAFYLVPVALTSWYAGTRAGIGITVLSGLDWLWMEYLIMPSGIPPWVPLLNEALRFLVLIAASLSLSRLRLALNREVELASRDPLTNLLNRRTFEERCNFEIKRALRYGHALTVVMMDLDNFKWVNDNLGHAAGDAVLQSVAQALNARLRTFDAAGRLGGDEFFLLLPHTDQAGAEHFIAQLRDTLLDTMQRHGWPITFSIGAAVYAHPKDDAAKLLAAADAQMYQAKAAGKNTLRLVSHP